MMQFPQRCTQIPSVSAAVPSGCNADTVHLAQPGGYPSHFGYIPAVGPWNDTMLESASIPQQLTDPSHIRILNALNLTSSPATWIPPTISMYDDHNSGEQISVPASQEERRDNNKSQTLSIT